MKNTTLFLTIILILSLVLNFIQYINSGIAVNKLLFFETEYGMYETLVDQIKVANEEREKVEKIITIYLKPEITENQIKDFQNLIKMQDKKGIIDSIRFELK